MKHAERINMPEADRALFRQGLLLPVMEMFYSLQGEGYHTGKAAAFVRIGGCDVGCHWCDVKEGWNASIHPLTGVEEIIRFVKAQAAGAVVITGGEPLMYELGPLCTGLKKENVRIFIETSGTYALSGQYDWICLSPKNNQPPLPEMLHMADELKVIIHEASDLDWAERNAALVKDKCLLYLQPEWSRYREMLPLIVEYAKSHPDWMVSLQAHKFMNIP